MRRLLGMRWLLEVVSSVEARSKVEIAGASPENGAAHGPANEDRADG
jgi:hypothetical protein